MVKTNVVFQLAGLAVALTGCCCFGGVSENGYVYGFAEELTD